MLYPDFSEADDTGLVVGFLAGPCVGLESVGDAASLDDSLLFRVLPDSGLRRACSEPPLLEVGREGLVSLPGTDAALGDLDCPLITAGRAVDGLIVLMVSIILAAMGEGRTCVPGRGVIPFSISDDESADVTLQLADCNKYIATA